MKVIVTDRGVYRTPDEINGEIPAGEVTKRLGSSAWKLQEIHDLPPGPPLTVGHVRAVLEVWPDDMPMLMTNGHGWYTYIADVVGPAYHPGTGPEGQGEWSGESTGYELPTVMSGRGFDSRDL